MKTKSSLNISIIGLGVIGGSLGLAIKQHCKNVIVTGYDFTEQVEKALEKNAIDYGAFSLQTAVCESDIIFLCTSVSTIKNLLSIISSFTKESVIVTDVGSTKSEIVSYAKKYFKGKKIFIGGHPMTGSEGKGIEFADALLFQNATYVLCSENNYKQRIKPLTEILKTIGARILFLSAKDHDSVAAAISHLPQLLAVAMMEMVGKHNKRNPAFLQLAAGGFRDITRIASSPYEMWKDIFASNSKEISASIRQIVKLLLQYEKNIRSASGQKQFRRIFTAAKILRDAIPKNSKGFLHPLYEVYVAVEDKPGVLSQLTTALYKAKINIKDIELLKIRDGKAGTFRLSLDSKRDADKAKIILQKASIKVL